MKLINLSSEDEFKHIYDTYFNMMYRISLIYLSDIKEAEDVTQEAFMKLLTSTRTFNSEDHVKAWLITVTKNLSKDRIRNFWKSRRVDIEKISELIDQNSDDIKDPSLEYAVEELLKLPSKYKIVIYLFYYEDYYVKDISKMLEIKESTIQTQLARGRKLLERKIKERLNE